MARDGHENSQEGRDKVKLDATTITRLSWLDYSVSSNGDDSVVSWATNCHRLDSILLAWTSYENWERSVNETLFLTSYITQVCYIAKIFHFVVSRTLEQWNVFPGALFCIQGLATMDTWNFKCEKWSIETVISSNYRGQIRIRMCRSSRRVSSRKERRGSLKSARWSRRSRRMSSWRERAIWIDEDVLLGWPWWHQTDQVWRGLRNRGARCSQYRAFGPCLASHRGKIESSPATA